MLSHFSLWHSLFFPYPRGEEGLNSADETEGEVKYEPCRRHAIIWLTFSFFGCVKE
jgi:hypothetical protein